MILGSLLHFLSDNNLTFTLSDNDNSNNTYLMATIMLQISDKQPIFHAGRKPYLLLQKIK